MRFRKLRFLFYTTLTIVICLCTERLCHLATDGFSVLRITYPLLEAPQIEKQEPLINTILSQKFTYLDCGAQSYVFVSEDDQYVIKFFKFHHMLIPPWLKALPLPPPLSLHRQQKIAKKQKVVERLFQSYTIAYNLFKEESGLIYLHLHKTNSLLPSLYLIDRIGVHYVLKTDAFAFVIQRKGTLFYKTLQDEDLSHAKESISSILKLSISRCQKGIEDKDPDFSTNFGFIDGKVAQLDTGRFYLNEKETNPEVYTQELYRITRKFRIWLTENLPSLVSHLDEEIEHLTSSALKEGNSISLPPHQS